MPITKRDSRYHFDAVVAGQRIRCPLGTTSRAAALRLENRIVFALADGPRSVHWADLKPDLPPSSYKTLTANREVAASPELSSFQTRFEDKLFRREKLGEIAASTGDLYRNTAEVFFGWLAEHGIRTLTEITPAMVEEYLVCRKESIREKGGSGRGLATDFTTLASVFNHAQEEGILKQSPLKGKYKADTDLEGSEPFTPAEMERLAANVDDRDRLAFLLLKHTGMRGSDVAAVTWESINWTDRSLRWQTKKRRTWVTIPLHGLLMKELDAAFKDRNQQGQILPGMTRAKLYTLMKNLGRKAVVENCHPHRFRDSLAVSILAKGGTIYDVARMLGITIATADAHYTRFTEQLQERVRGILESE